ncbi:hypothetical protein [Agromyces sp. CCNWLW203]|uniref:hypothetical protein n=1 Tax=Agromyces sp. CCNWLW203 TaxID=3112842 RepID=UPI002F96BCA6
MTAPVPEGCPPPDAVPMEGTFYRLAARRHAVGDITEEDSWLRPYATHGNGYYKRQEECDAHGLSIYASEDDIERARIFVPSLGTKPIAEVVITLNDGTLAHRPLPNVTTHGETHHDWWTTPHDLIPQARVVKPGREPE